jgi:transposase
VVQRSRALRDLILDLFMVERDATAANIVGTAAHLELRRCRSTPILERLEAWMNVTAPHFEPKSPMGEALRYLKNQWSRLRVFLDDRLVPLHNNASEAALRIVALMRKNSLFFGNERAGRRFVTLYSLIAICERHDVNPEVYLADILIRIQDYPADRVAELLPHRWKKTNGSGFTVERIVTPGDAT